MHYNRGVPAQNMHLGSVSANELARICGESGDQDAWCEFVRRFQRPIALAVLRAARYFGVQTAAILDDLVQETFLRLCADDCRLLKSFVPREPDSVIGYLKVVAANVAHDKLRAERTLKRGGALRRQEPETADQESVFLAPNAPQAIDRSIRHREIDQALQSVIPQVLTERDRTIFWLYFEQGFTAREIGAIASIGLTVKGVESSIHRSSQQVRERLIPKPASNATSEGIPGPFVIYKEEP